MAEAAQAERTKSATPRSPREAALLRQLDDAQPKQRIAAATELARRGGTAAWTRLLALAGTDPPELRAAVVRTLRLLARDRDLREVTRAAAASLATPTRCADLVAVVTRAGTRSAARAVLAADLARLWPQANAFELRYRLLRAVGRLDPTGQLALLLAGSTSDDPVLRWIAVEQLRDAPIQAATGGLRHALNDRDPRVRRSAALALGNRPRSKPIATDLVRLLRADHWPMVVAAAAEALGRHCFPSTIDALRWAVRHASPGADVAATESLVACSGDNGEIGRRLIALAEDSRLRTPVRARALTVMPAPAVERHVSRLIALFRELRPQALASDGAARIAAACAYALGTTSDAQAKRELHDATQNDPHPGIRAAAARALARSR
jgi:HEAT repeat protein